MKVVTFLRHSVDTMRRDCLRNFD